MLSVNLRAQAAILNDGNRGSPYRTTEDVRAQDLGQLKKRHTYRSW
jgi:hypothetical protein